MVSKHNENLKFKQKLFKILKIIIIIIIVYYYRSYRVSEPNWTGDNFKPKSNLRPVLGSQRGPLGP